MADEENVNDAASADAEAVEEPAAAESPEAVVEEAPAAEESSDEPAAEPVPADQETPAAAEAVDEPAAEAADPEPGTEAESETGSSSASAKRKRKRLPRSERPKRTRPKRVPSAERKPIVRLESPEHERGRRQERQGTVVSDAMEKTIVVRVDVVKAHPRYKKVVRRSVKFHAHDESSQAKVGDIVRIVETRPLSKTKRWRLAEVVEAAK